MSIYTPYTYLIGWSAHNKWYYGVRFAKDCNPADFWKEYFTSSKYVHEFRETHGEPDVITIRKTFNTKEKAILWEKKVLQRMKVVKDQRWINRNDREMFYIDEHSEETKRKISIAHLGKTLDPEHCKLLSKLRIGKKHSEETKQKIREAIQGRKCSEKTKDKISKANTGKKRTDEAKQKMRKAKLKK